MLSIIEEIKISKLNFEVNATATKIMALAGLLSAASPTLAKDPDSTSPKAKDAVTTTVIEKDLEMVPPPLPALSEVEGEKGEIKGDLNTISAPADALSVEKLADLSDIIPTGAPEVFDDDRTEPWKREVMRNHILKAPNGGNYSFFSAEIGGQKKIFAMTASHVNSTPVGDPVEIGGDLFGFETQGGIVIFEGIVKADIGPGDPNSTDNKFKIIEIIRYWGIDGGELDAGPNDYKTLRTFPLAVDPIDTTDPGYIGGFSQSGNWSIGLNPIPGYDPALAGRWVAPVNLDPTGTQYPLTKMQMPDPADPIFGGKTLDVPLEKFAMDSTNFASGTSGESLEQVLDPTLTPANMRDKNAGNFLTKDIIEDNRILGAIQGITHPNDNEGVLSLGITLVQPYRSEIEQAIGGTLLDIAWDLEISGTGDTREVGKVVDIITAVDIENGPTLPEGYTLEQNYPNPFNPSTTIEFEIPESQNVTIEVFNLLGQKVATLLSRYIHAGPNSVKFNAQDLSSGIYVYRIVTEKGVIASKKMVLLR